jgi:hypothetical protein
MTTPIQLLCGILYVETPPCALYWTTLTGAWAACTDGSWMLRVAGRLSGPAWSDGRRPLVLASCDCAELDLPRFEKRHPGDRRPRAAIEVSRRWAHGDPAVTPQDVRDANAIIWAAAADALGPDSADAAWAAAYDAWSASGGAAAAAVKSRVLAQCADIVRKHFPDLLRLMISCDIAEVRLLAIANAGELEVAA